MRKALQAGLPGVTTHQTRCGSGLEAGLPTTLFKPTLRRQHFAGYVLAVGEPLA
jgi:hypothetical protein